MRSLTIAAIAVSTVALTQVASAADLPRKAPAYTLPPPLPFSWTGFYVGLNAGGGWGTSDTSTTFFDPNQQFALFSGQGPYMANMSPSLKPVGFSGGGQIGYNWQTGNIVFGLESDFNYFHLTNSVSTSVTPPHHDTLHTTTDVHSDWLFTGRGRLGWAFDNAMLYVTGGVAVTELKYSQFNNFVGCCTETASFSNTKAGWTVGGGAEWMFAPRWSVKAEYLFVDFGSGHAVGFETAAHTQFNHSADLKANIVRAGLNYHF